MEQWTVVLYPNAGTEKAGERLGSIGHMNKLHHHRFSTMSDFALLGAFLMGAATGIHSVNAQTEVTPKKVAIFVENRAGAEFDSKAVVFEDFLASRIADQQMQVLSREVILNSLRDFSAGGSSGADSPGQKLDRLLSDSTSALRLAHNLGADYILLPTLASYGKETRAYKSDTIETVNDTYTLRVSYRLAEAARGGEVGGDTLTASRTLRQSAGLQVQSSDALNQLLDEVAQTMAASLIAKQDSLPEVAKTSSRVKVTIECGVTDFAELPNAGLNENNEVVLGSGNARATALDVNVELNGITIGTAPATLEVPAGLNKLRLTREGFKPYERTVNFYDGQTLTVALQMTDNGYARWKDVVATLTALENNRKLTDAEVEVLQGYAQMLRQSGIKVDTKEGMKFYRGVYW